MNDKANKRGVYYWRGEKPYISVTTILGIIDKSNALIPWACGETYDALMINPSISREEAVSANRGVSEEAKSRGKAVHDIIQAYKGIGEVVGKDGPYGGYAKAFQKFVDDHPFKPVYQEESIVSEKYGIGGTLDLLVEMQGKKILIDAKSNKDGRLYQEVQLQLSAYAKMLEEQGIKVEGMYGLALAPDETYTFKPFTADFESFMHAKGLYVWKNKSSLEKVGYR